MNVIILVDNKPTEVSDDACREIMRLRSENAALRETLAIEQERSLYWRSIAARKEAQP